MGVREVEYRVSVSKNVESVRTCRVLQTAEVYSYVRSNSLSLGDLRLEVLLLVDNTGRTCQPFVYAVWGTHDSSRQW